MSDLRPIYNEAKLTEFGQSMYCPAELRGKGNEELYAALADESARGMYDAFVHMRWLREYTRRKAEARLSGGEPTFRDKLQAEAFREALYAERIAAGSTTVPLQSGTKNYARLFADKVDETEWNEVELEVRKMFLEDLEKAKKAGGCSGCKRGALVRRYVARVRELTN